MHMNRNEAIEYMHKHGDMISPCSTPGLMPPPGWGFVNDGEGWYLMCDVENLRAAPASEEVAPIFDSDISA